MVFLSINLLKRGPETLVPEWASIFHNSLEYNKNSPSAESYYYTIIIISKENKV